MILGLFHRLPEASGKHEGARYLGSSVICLYNSEVAQGAVLRTRRLGFQSSRFGTTSPFEDHRTLHPCIPIINPNCPFHAPSSLPFAFYLKTQYNGSNRFGLPELKLQWLDRKCNVI